MNKKPPVKPIFLKKEIISSCSEKSKWNKNAVIKQKSESIPADILAL